MCLQYTATLVIILAWLVQNMSTHGGEETWSMTLKNIYTKLDNIRNLIPGKRNHQKREKGKAIQERSILFQSTLIPARTCKVQVMTQLLFEALNA